AVSGGTPTVANTALINAFGRDGDDRITLNEANGALPAAHLFGGDGNDSLIGGSGGDQLFGEDGNDTLLGRGGFDLLVGGAGTDTAEVNGGNGAEQFSVAANGTRVRFDRINPAPFSLDIGTTESLV